MSRHPRTSSFVRRAGLIAAASLATACADAHHVDVMTVLAQGNCQTEKTGVELIDYATLATYRGTHLIGMSESPEAQRNPAHLIAIAPAQFPTAGYGVALLDGSTLTDKLLTIRIKIERPPADAVLAQMITHPCLVVGIADPAVGRVRVLNDSALLGEVEIPPAQVK
jgi:hypothetical protein